MTWGFFGNRGPRCRTDTIQRQLPSNPFSNCAGIRSVGTVLDVDPADWRRAMSVNLDGTFNTCQAFARALSDELGRFASGSTR